MIKRLKTYPARIAEITEKQFWQTLRNQPRRPGAAHLREAITHGRAGRLEKAYAALAAYHREALADEWAFVREQAANQPKPAPAVIKDLCNHKIAVWHHQVVQFGNKIDWITPEVNGNSLNGFHYHGWLRPAVTAWIQTGDAKPARFVREVVTQYFDLHQHPLWNDQKRQPSIKLLVYNQLGVSARSQAWVPAYLAAINTTKPDWRYVRAFVQSFLAGARAIEPQNPTFQAHNIQTHGCHYLLRIARLFPEFKEAPQWDRFATGRLHEQVTRGFFKDGCHGERVWGYGSHTLEALHSAYETARRHGGLGKHEKTFRNALKKSYQFYAKTLGPKPKRYLPTYGDAGPGGGENIIKRGRSLFPASQQDDLGVDRGKSYCFKPSGFVVMRNGQEKNSVYVNANFGAFAGWHSHMDLLSMNLWAHGEMLLEELCRFGPYNIPLDHMFREPASHNLLLVDGMVYNSICRRGENVAWYSDEHVDYFSATHNAYTYYVFNESMKEGTTISPNRELTIRRTILMVKDPGYVVVMDSLENLHGPAASPAITQQWHSPFTFKRLDDRSVRTVGKVGCLMTWARPEGLKRLDASCDFTAKETAEFGASYDRYRLQARRWMPLKYTGHVGFTTLIMPFDGKLPRASIVARPTEIDRMWRVETFDVVTPRGKDVITLDPQKQAGDLRATVKLSHQRKPIPVR